MQTLLIPELEETKVTLNFKDGQEPLVLDVVDLDKVLQAMPETVPEGSTWEREYAERFELFFHRKISRSAARMLWQYQTDTMQALKKNCYVSPVQSSSTDSVTFAPKEI